MNENMESYIFVNLSLYFSLIWRKKKSKKTSTTIRIYCIDKMAESFKNVKINQRSSPQQSSVQRTSEHHHQHHQHRSSVQRTLEHHHQQHQHRSSVQRTSEHHHQQRTSGASPRSSGASNDDDHHRAKSEPTVRTIAPRSSDAPRSSNARSNDRSNDRRERARTNLSFKTRGGAKLCKRRRLARLRYYQSLEREPHSPNRRNRGRESDGAVSFDFRLKSGSDKSTRTRLGSTNSNNHNEQNDKLVENAIENGELLDYKALWEAEKLENEKLKQQQLKKRDDELSSTKTALERFTNATTKNSLTELEKREKRAMERKLSEMEEELKHLDILKAENQRLKEENAALIRVISKLSK